MRKFQFKFLTERIKCYTTSEEEVKLSRSAKKVKEYGDSQQRPFHGFKPNVMGPSLLPESSTVKKSFKDKLIGEILGAYA